MNFQCGFTTDLDNGLTVSVQYHDCAYATRDDDDKLVSVEMACWTTRKRPGEMKDNRLSGQWLSRDVWPDDCIQDDVLGHLPVDKVMHMMDIAGQLTMDYVSLLATQRKTANMKREAEELKRETEELKRESAEMTAKLESLL